MIPYYVALCVSIAVAILFAFCFKKTFKKLSWKFLTYSLILTKIPDIFTTCLGNFNILNPDYEIRSPMFRWMLININLPDVIVLLIHAIIVVSLLLLIFRFMWRDSRPMRITAKIFLLAFSIGSILVSISNLGLYLSG